MGTLSQEATEGRQSWDRVVESDRNCLTARQTVGEDLGIKTLATWGVARVQIEMSEGIQRPSFLHNRDGVLGVGGLTC